MAAFKSHTSYYDFVNSVNQWRYVRNAEQEDFLATVLETSESRKEELPTDYILWRAQVDHDWRHEEVCGEKVSEQCPSDVKRMKPVKDRASEGRANPKGILYLYTAIEKETAIAEVRPWVGAYVSVAQLEVSKSLTLMNFTSDPKPGGLKVFGAEPNAAKREQVVWQNMNEAFSRPLTQNEPVDDYVPTQIIAEMFRHNGIDGLLYNSSLGNGDNIALFDLNNAEIINCRLFQVKSVKFDSVETGSQYFVKR